jgi:hypothetical protein
VARNLNPLKRKLETLLASRLRDFRSDIQRAELADRILGFIVSSDFDDLEYPERQKLFGEIIESELTREEIAFLGPIILYTPAEVSVKESA